MCRDCRNTTIGAQMGRSSHNNRIHRRVLARKNVRVVKPRVLEHSVAKRTFEDDGIDFNCREVFCALKGIWQGGNSPAFDEAYQMMRFTYPSVSKKSMKKLFNILFGPDVVVNVSINASTGRTTTRRSVNLASILAQLHIEKLPFNTDGIAEYMVSPDCCVWYVYHHIMTSFIESGILEKRFSKWCVLTEKTQGSMYDICCSLFSRSNIAKWVVYEYVRFAENRLLNGGTINEIPPMAKFFGSHLIDGLWIIPKVMHDWCNTISGWRFSIKRVLGSTEVVMDARSSKFVEFLRNMEFNFFKCFKHCFEKLYRESPQIQWSLISEAAE